MAVNEKIKPSHDIKIKWTDDEGNNCMTIMPPFHANGKRIVWLVESNYVDIGSVGAMHYYARIRVHAPSWSVNGDHGGHGGYGGKNQPKIEPISFDAERILKVREKDANGKSLGKVGDSTYRFNDEKSARRAAIAVFKKKFAAGWVLIPETLSGDENEIAAQT
jgi:hypothetical protein